MSLCTIEILSHSGSLDLTSILQAGELLSFELLSRDPASSAHRLEVFLDDKERQLLEERLQQAGHTYRIRDEAALLHTSWLSMIPSPMLAKRKLLPLSTDGALKQRLAHQRASEGELLLTARGRVLLVSDGRGLSDPREAPLLLERDGLLLARYARLEPLPLWLAHDNDEDFIKSVVALAPNASFLRLSALNTDEPLQLVERIREQARIPVVHAEFTERALLYVASLLNVLARHDMEVAGKTVGILGVDVAGLGILELLLPLGPARVLGVDADFRKLARFEKREGIASSLENIYNNAEIILITPDNTETILTDRLAAGQIVLDFSGGALNSDEPGKEHEGWIFTHAAPHPACILPGLFLALAASGVDRIGKEEARKLLHTLTTHIEAPAVLPLPARPLFERQKQALL